MQPRRSTSALSMAPEGPAGDTHDRGNGLGRGRATHPARAWRLELVGNDVFGRAHHQHRESGDRRAVFEPREVVRREAASAGK